MDEKVKTAYKLTFQEPDGNVEIRCDNMDLCGDIIQALGVDYLGLDYLVPLQPTISYCECTKKLMIEINNDLM